MADHDGPAATAARVQGAGQRNAPGNWQPRRTYAALDLGTNNCRLLIARPSGDDGFVIVDAFSRVVRLGEGLTASGRFVSGAVPGDYVTDLADIIPGPNRQDPPCRHLRSAMTQKALVPVCAIRSRLLRFSIKDRHVRERLFAQVFPCIVSQLGW